MAAQRVSLNAGTLQKCSSLLHRLVHIPESLGEKRAGIPHVSTRICGPGKESEYTKLTRSVTSAWQLLSTELIKTNEAKDPLTHLGPRSCDGFTAKSG